MKMSAKIFFLQALVLISTVAASAVSVTFSVNMSVQQSLGNFTPPNGDLVETRGSFATFPGGAWMGGVMYLTPSGNPDVYTATYDITNAPGSTVQFKFVMTTTASGEVWEGNVGPNGAQNRAFVVPSVATNLPVVYFNNITNANLPVIPVTFRVNMSVQSALGNFNPLSDGVTVAGDSVNNWSATANALTNSGTNADIWMTTVNITNQIGSTVAFKYTINNGTTWESIPDRTFTLAASSQVLPVVFFNNITNVPSAIPLTFTVNMGVQQALGNFNPDLGDIVEARGNFLAGGGGAWLGGFMLTNSPANPLVYSGTWVDTNHIVGANVQYQFVLNNGATWENIGNRNYTITDTNPQTLPFAFFNNITSLGTLSVSKPSGGQVMISWSAGTHVRLQSAGSIGGPWSDVGGTEGLSSTNINVGAGPQFFRLIGP